MSYSTEFTSDYVVPDEVIAHVRSGALVDLSWHNDACPHFVLAADKDLDDVAAMRGLWVEHPEPELREIGGPRFIVSHGEVSVAMDDLDGALRYLFSLENQITKIQK